MKSNQGVEGGQAPEPLSPSVYFSVKWVHSLPVLCCGEGGEGMASPSLNAELKKQELASVEQNRDSSQCGCGRRGAPEGDAFFCVPQTRLSAPAVLSCRLPILSVPLGAPRVGAKTRSLCTAEHGTVRGPGSAGAG